MQPFELLEDSVVISGVNADSIIPYGEDPFAVFQGSSDRHLRSAFPAVFDGISDQVFKNTQQLSPIRAKGGECSDRNHCARILDQHLLDSESDDGLTVDKIVTDFPMRCSGKREDVIDKLFHAF